MHQSETATCPKEIEKLGEEDGVLSAAEFERSKSFVGWKHTVEQEIETMEKALNYEGVFVLCESMKTHVRTVTR